MSRFGNLGAKLYKGEVSYDFIGKAKTWYAVSAVLLLLSIGAFLFRGLDYGIEFEGGAVFIADAPGGTVAEAREAVLNAGVEEIGDPTVTQLGGDSIRVETLALRPERSTLIRDALADALGIQPDEVQRQLVGPSWGGEITNKAHHRPDRLHRAGLDLPGDDVRVEDGARRRSSRSPTTCVTVGIYALVGFEVTPATVIGLLTILGYSLYDTVVVFDKVRENTRGILSSNRWTYAQAANLAVNQTLVRSINTSIVALLPVLGLLVGGVVLVGAGALNDLALVLLVGMAVGAYSSIFIATPILVQLKEREPAIRAQRARVLARQALAGASAAATAAERELPGSSAAGTTTIARTRNVVPVGQRQQPKKVSRERRSSPPKKRK